jgi:hypothetical protein
MREIHRSANAPALSSLEKFRQHVAGTEFDEAHSPYTLNKPRSHTYKTIFLTLGAILMLLGITVFARSSNTIFELHIGYYWLIKLLVGCFSLLLGICAVTIGCRLRNEKEVAFSIWRDAHRKLARLYQCKLSGVGGTRFYLFAAHPLQAQPVRRAYLEALEQIRDQRERNGVLLSQIARAPFVPAEEREKLFNRALSELRRAQEEVVRNFSLSEYQWKETPDLGCQPA